MTNHISDAHAAVTVSTTNKPDLPHVAGFDFELMLKHPEMHSQLNPLLSSFASTGFQATNLARAIEEVQQMLNWRDTNNINPLIDQDSTATSSGGADARETTIFLGYTSNMVSCGNREVIRFLVKHKLVDVLVSTAGGIEEDFIKCLSPTLIGDFHLSGTTLRKQGLNRIGNLLLPNDNYCVFEDWLVPILDAMVSEQNELTSKNTIGGAYSWTPSEMIARLGREINNEESIYYWAARNNIPVFCPALTDGSIGDMIFFHSYKAQDPSKQLRLDIVEDVRRLNSLAMRAKHTGILCLGGGVVKHHICNANLMRNGADHAVFINTGLEFDGSDSGASPDEAVSWGKIKAGAQPIKVHCDASIAFPLLVHQAFLPFAMAKHDALCRQASSDLYM